MPRPVLTVIENPVFQETTYFSALLSLAWKRNPDELLITSNFASIRVGEQVKPLCHLHEARTPGLLNAIMEMAVFDPSQSSQLKVGRIHSSSIKLPAGVDSILLERVDLEEDNFLLTVEFETANRG